MPQKKNSALQLEGGAKAPSGGLVRRQLLAIRNKIPTKEAVLAGSRRIVREGASVIGKKMNQARVAVGLLSQNFKRSTRRRKLLIEESPPATPAKEGRSDVDVLISPFEIPPPVGKRERAARSAHVTPRRPYLDIWEALSGRDATLIPETAVYRNGCMGISDMIPPAGKTPGDLSNTELGGDAAASPATPGLSDDVENINEGISHLHAIADFFAGENNPSSCATPLR